MSAQLLLIGYMAGMLLSLALACLIEHRFHIRRAARYWRRFEAAMDSPESAVVILEQVEMSKVGADLYIDALIKRGLQTIEDVMRVH